MHKYCSKLREPPITAAGCCFFDARVHQPFSFPAVAVGQESQDTLDSGEPQATVKCVAASSPRH